MEEASETDIYDVSVSLSLVGFGCDPDDVSTHLDLHPTHVVRKGQGFPPPRDPDHRAKHNVWSLSPELKLPRPLPHCIQMSWLLEPLEAALEPRQDRLAGLPSDCVRPPQITVYITPWKVVPAFEFAPADLAFLLRTGLHFEIDIQNFDPEESHSE